MKKIKYKQTNNQYKNYVKIRSTIHSDIYHTIEVNLRCHERMPSEKKLYEHSKQLARNQKKYRLNL